MFVVRHPSTIFFPYSLFLQNLDWAFPDEQVYNQQSLWVSDLIEEAASSTHAQKYLSANGERVASDTQSVSRDKGKGRAAVQEEFVPQANRYQAPRPAEDDASIWDRFGGIGALEEEDALVRQRQLFGETAYPGYAQVGVAGPSGTKHEHHVDSVGESSST
ncbi:hypothetical protein FRB90_009221 [Tulasnella sp. 427]|nr:hypothetical protein FRB90_009221 [Tulasnella sp. 427]